ncbi:hypothetical protein HMPREF1579_01275, partial [Gardnerella vaginalis JCP8066]
KAIRSAEPLRAEALLLRGEDARALSCTTDLRVYVVRLYGDTP